MISKTKFSFESIICYVLLVLIAAKLFSSGLFKSNDYIENELSYSVLSQGWEQVLADGRIVPAEVPGDAVKDGSNRFEIQSTLPDSITEHTWLSIRSTRQNIYIYIDGQLRKSYYRTFEEYGRTTVPSFYLFVQLHKDDIGKNIRIVGSSAYSSFAYDINEVVMGNQMGIWYYYTIKDYSGFVLPLIVFFIAIGVLSILLIVSIYSKTSRRFIFLGLGVLLYSSWEVCDSHLRQLLFYNVSVASDAAYMIFSLIPIPFLYSLDILLQKRYHKSNMFCALMIASLSVVTGYLNDMGHVAFIFTMPYLVAGAVLSTIYMLITIFIDIFKKRLVENKITISGYLGFAVSGVIAGVFFAIKPETPATPIVNLGMIMIMVCAVVDMIHSYVIDRRDRIVAEEVSSAKSQFIASMSHEIRTPINSIMGMDEMILRESREEEITAYARNIRDYGKSLLRLVNEILDYSRLESGNVNLIEETFDAEIAITSLYKIFEPIADKKGLKMELREHGIKGRLLLGDNEKICKMIGEILTNAINYTDEGKVTLEAFIEDLDKTDETGHDLVMFSIRVTDTGVGISDTDLKKIFDPFENTGEKDGQSGMSLVVVNRMLEAMGSRLSVRSRLGKGSEFSFDIIQKKAGEIEIAGWNTKTIEPDLSILKEKGRYYSEKLNVLCVDDSTMNLSVIEGLLKRTGASIKTAISGEDAVSLAILEQYDVIFMDHRMPGMGGEKAMNMLRKHYQRIDRKIVIIALTGNEFEGARKEYLKMGFDDYLSKPVKTFDLEKMLWTYCEDMAQNPPEVVDESCPYDDIFDSIKGVDGINTDSGIKYCGSKELFVNAVKTFVDTSDDNIQMLNDLINSKDLKNGVIKVHALKSNARVIGCGTLSEHAAFLEERGDKGDVETFWNGVPKLLTEYIELTDRLKAICKEHEVATDEDSLMEITPDELKDAYSAIEECAISLDYDSIEQILNELAGYKLGDEDKKKVALIKKGLAAVDNDRIIKAIKAEGSE
jgi:signal transduction histidine kinase/ActR/RegA family two-component response regulator/HPt (histidine-containing phosphotransfer) domain-containing protein